MLKVHSAFPHTKADEARTMVPVIEERPRI
jgi:hypothetical protein